LNSEIGIVESTQEGMAYVAFATKAECSRCGACGGAGGRLLARNEAGAEIGQTVRVEASDGAMVSVALVMFALPALALFAGIGLGALAGKAFGIPLPLASALLGAAGFAAAIRFAVVYDRKSKRQSAAVMRIVETFDSAMEAEGGLSR
jgi:sigma-E factor negative regulatory protein RseC